MSDIKVSIVIRCYNEEEHIGRLLEGILLQSFQSMEIVVVDSGSTDATLAIVSRYPVKLLNILPEDFSFGRSLNMGCEAASADFIIFASAHVYPVFKNWVEKMLIPFSDDKIALVYGKQSGSDVTKFSEHQIFAQWFGETSNYSQSHPFCNNANAAIRRSIWEKIHYDETLSGLEDLGWAVKASELGYRIVYNAEAEVHHVHNETWSRVYQRYRREAISMKQICPSERFNLWDFFRLFSGNVASDFYHAWHEGVLGKNILSIFLFRLMQFWGTFRGFCQQGPISGELRQKFYYPQELSRKAKPTNSGSSDENRIDYSKERGSINS